MGLQEIRLRHPLSEETVMNITRVAKSPNTTCIIIILAILMLMLSGCATYAKGGHQSVSVVLHNATHPTVCTLTNGSGSEVLNPPRRHVTRVSRSVSDLFINCSNSHQHGSDVLESKFHSEYLVQDLLLDLCIISCIVDSSTGAWHSYPSISNIYMENIK